MSRPRQRPPGLRRSRQTRRWQIPLPSDLEIIGRLREATHRHDSDVPFEVGSVRNGRGYGAEYAFSVTFDLPMPPKWDGVHDLGYDFLAPNGLRVDVKGAGKCPVWLLLKQAHYLAHHADVFVLYWTHDGVAECMGWTTYEVLRRDGCTKITDYVNRALVVEALSQDFDALRRHLGMT